MTEPTLDNMTQRLERLERENRRMKLAGVLMLLGIAAVMVMGQAGSAKQSIVTAEQFVLQDKNGRERGRFMADYNGNTGITLRDSNGKIRFAIALEGNGLTWLSIYGEKQRRMFLGADRLGITDSEGRTSIGALVKPDGDAYLNISGNNNEQASLSATNISLFKDDKPRFVTSVGANGGATLWLYGKEKEELKLTSFGLLVRDGSGEERIIMGADTEGGNLYLSGEKSLIDLGVEKQQELSLTTRGVTVRKNDKARLSLDLQDNGNPMLMFTDKYKIRLMLVLQDDGDPALQFRDKYSRSRFLAGLNGGAPLITMEDEDGKIIWAEP